MVMAPPHKRSAAFLCSERRVKEQENTATNQRKRNGLKNKEVAFTKMCNKLFHTNHVCLGR